MTSKPQGCLVVPVWSDDGEVKPIADDAGKIPVDADISGQTVDISGQTVDISGQIVDIAGQSVVVSGQVTLPTTTNIYVKPLCLYAGGYRSLPLVWGFSDVYKDVVNFTLIANGNYTLNGTTLTAGNIAKIEGMSFIFVSTSISTVQLQAYINGTSIIVKEFQGATSGTWYSWDGEISLKPGDKLIALFYNGSIGDAVYLHSRGYTMSYA